MTSPEHIDESTWIERYRPLPNPVDDQCGYDFGDGCTMVDDYPAHVAYLSTIPENRIWTVVETDTDMGQILVSGRHHVNRICNIVTAQPWPHDIEVRLED